jgi:sterol desaturase/sphingolipid hydroxylase (fatty acid hydroxylase superfamily)
MASDAPFPVEALLERALEGLWLSIGTFMVTVVLELWSLDTVKKVLSQTGGSSLYAKAVTANLRNHFLFGSPLYAVASLPLCRNDEELGTTERIVCLLTILFIHSVGFYVAHRSFHTYPSLYKHHRFHHRFNVHVPPMAANAVSSVEYTFAYIVPFIIAMPFVKPDPLSLQLSVAIISIANVLIHTPKLIEISERVLPAWWVSTSDHLEHHRKLNTKYAAPTFNLDYCVNVFTQGIPSNGGNKENC